MLRLVSSKELLTTFALEFNICLASNTLLLISLWFADFDGDVDGSGGVDSYGSIDCDV